MGRDFHRRHLLGRKARAHRLPQRFPQRLQRRMGAVAAGVIFVADRRQHEIAPEPRERGLVPHPGMGCGEGLHGTRIGGEAARRETCCFHPERRRRAGVVGLGHGAEARLQPARAGGREAERLGHLPRSEPQKARGGEGGGEGAGSGRLVKAGLVMGAPEPGAEMRRRLVADQRGFEKGPPACPFTLGDGESGGKDHHRQMADMEEMGIVVIERMRGGAIRERSRARRHLRATRADHCRFARAPLAQHHLAQDPACFLPRPRQRHGGEIEKRERERGARLGRGIGKAE